MWTYDKINQYLKTVLKEKRYIHSINVSNTAVALAMQYNCDIEKAKLAGLIHDCAKNMQTEELLLYLKERNEIIDEVSLLNPDLLHGRVASIIGKEKMGIEDYDVLNAVTYHTVGRAHMSTLEKIIYLGDFIEPSRNFQGIEEIRALAKEDLDKALLLAINHSIVYVTNSNMLLHYNTVEARNYLISEEKFYGK